MEIKISYAPLKLCLIVLTFFINCVSSQRPQAVDTWKLINRDRYILTYTVPLRQTPHVSWWWKSTAGGSQFEVLEHFAMDNFRETVTPDVATQPNGDMRFDVRLEITNINSNIFGEYKVVIDGNNNLTRYFTVNEMPDKTLDGLSEIPAASDGDNKFEFSKNQVYIAVIVAVGILMVVAFISIALVIRIKMKKAGRSATRRDIQTDNNSEGISISSHHYTDVHSNGGYEGLGEKQDTHEYLTTRNTMANRGAYNDPAIHNPVTTQKKTTGSFANAMYEEPIIKASINPSSLLKPVPKFKYKKKQTKARRFSDSTSDREDTCTYENVAKYAPNKSNYVNCNNLKRTKSAQ